MVVLIPSYTSHIVLRGDDARSAEYGRGRSWGRRSNAKLQRCVSRTIRRRHARHVTPFGGRHASSRTRQTRQAFCQARQSGGRPSPPAATAGMVGPLDTGVLESMAVRGPRRRGCCRIQVVVLKLRFAESLPGFWSTLSVLGPLVVFVVFTSASGTLLSTPPSFSLIWKCRTEGNV